VTEQTKQLSPLDALRRSIQATRDEADASRLASPPRGAAGALLMLVIAGIALSMTDGVGGASDWASLARLLAGLGATDAAREVAAWMREPVSGSNHRLIYWALNCQLWYLLLPLLWATLAARHSITELGLGLGRIRDHVQVYLVLAALLTPLLFLVSAQPAFLRVYPYFDPLPGAPLWPDFWRLELLYFAQFAAVEFFFRGFLVQGLRSTFGYASIYVSLLPYCMIHFGKPLPEVLAALVAGLVLGHLSLASRSIWPGVALHIFAAATMDLAVLWRKGLLG
jgi:membrane protease YdiL (CAAX protease family)